MTPWVAALSAHRLLWATALGLSLAIGVGAPRIAAQPNEASGARTPPRVEPGSLERGDDTGGFSIDPRTGAPVVVERPERRPARVDAARRTPSRPDAAALRKPDDPEDFDPDAFEVDDLDLDSLSSGVRPGAEPVEEVEPAPPVAGVSVVLRGLDKMTGEVDEAEADVGAAASLWRLEIDVKACYARPEASASAAGSAFIQIRDTKPDPAETVFSGWMFAASPALSAMDHPRYDVWVLSCKIS